MKGNVGKGNPFEDEPDTEVDAETQVSDPPPRTRRLTLPYGARITPVRVSVTVR